MAEGLAAILEQMQSRVGVENAPGDWFLVTQDRVNQFADVTGDHQFIHVDPERAKNTPFGGTIAHGFLTLSLCLMLPRYKENGSNNEATPPPARSAEGPQMKMAVNYGMNKVRFPSPVPVGKRIRAKTKLLSVEEVAPNCLQNVNQITIEVEGLEKPAAVIELAGRQYYSATTPGGPAQTPAGPPGLPAPCPRRAQRPIKCIPRRFAVGQAFG